MLHVQKQHAGSVRVVAGMDAGKLIVNVILGQHDLVDPGEKLRLMLPHPQNFRRGEACEGDVGGVL